MKKKMMSPKAKSEKMEKMTDAKSDKKMINAAVKKSKGKGGKCKY